MNWEKFLKGFPLQSPSYFWLFSFPQIFLKFMDFFLIIIFIHTYIYTHKILSQLTVVNTVHVLRNDNLVLDN